MNRILEFTPSQEEAVVARVLVLVHQAVDENFPAIAQANRQFTKTVFSGEGESTSIVRAPLDSDGNASQFGSSEDTSPVGKAAPDAHVVPPPPSSTQPVPPPPRQGVRPAVSSSPAAGTGARENSRPPGPPTTDKSPVRDESGHGVSGHATGTKSTRLDMTMEGFKVKPPVDWVTRITLALLVAGLLLLAYALFS